MSQIFSVVGPRNDTHGMETVVYHQDVILLWTTLWQPTHCDKRSQPRTHVTLHLLNSGGIDPSFRGCGES